jgi:hypothetical protein
MTTRTRKMGTNKDNTRKQFFFIYCNISRAN